MIKIHPHAKERMLERGVKEEEVVTRGEPFLAKFNRNGFRRNFIFNGLWRGRSFNVKQVEVITINENDDIIIITVVAKYF